jgi:hypothetical protein
MTFNPEGLTIEINMSNNVSYIDTIMGYKPDANRLVGCHNFYPHSYLGLKLDFFRECTRRFKQYDLRTAAFVSSQAQHSFGPWPVDDGLPDVERDIIFNTLHFNRGDVSSSMIRFILSRIKYRGHHFELFNAPGTIRRGDVVIESSEYSHYAGELQIALADMRNSGKSNVVGHIPDEQHFLLDTIESWQKFQFHKSC